MKIAVIYIYPLAMSGLHDSLAARFVATYKNHFPSLAHKLYFVSNGGKPTPTMLKTFGGIDCQYVVHDNSGWDIGAYRKCAREIECDLMVFFGASAYLRGTGWLECMAEAFQKYGPAIYGAMGSVWPNIHIRTTGFWMPPDLMNSYPHETNSSKESRYAFEHSKDSLTFWVLSKGLKALVVTWTGEFEWRQWDKIPNGYNRGDQSALLVGDRLTDPPHWPRPIARPIRPTPRRYR